MRSIGRLLLRHPVADAKNWIPGSAWRRPRNDGLWSAARAVRNEGYWRHRASCNSGTVRVLHIAGNASL